MIIKKEPVDKSSKELQIQEDNKFVQKYLDQFKIQVDGEQDNKAIELTINKDLLADKNREQILKMKNEIKVATESLQDMSQVIKEYQILQQTKEEIEAILMVQKGLES